MTATSFKVYQFLNQASDSLYKLQLSASPHQEAAEDSNYKETVFLEPNKTKPVI
jgi:hypothetical protein